MNGSNSLFRCSRAPRSPHSTGDRIFFESFPDDHRKPQKGGRDDESRRNIARVVDAEIDAAESYEPDEAAGCDSRRDAIAARGKYPAREVCEKAVESERHRSVAAREGKARLGIGLQSGGRPRTRDRFLQNK